MDTAPARRSLTRRALTAAVTAAVLAITMLGMETAYAVWHDRSGADAGTVSTGTAGLTAEWSTEADAADWQHLLPGDEVHREVTVTNTGEVPLALSAAASVFTASLQPAPDGGVSGAEPVIGPGQTARMLIELTVTPELAPGQQVEVEVQLEGRQVA